MKGDPKSIRSKADEDLWFANRREQHEQADAFQRRLNALSTRQRLEAYRRANAGEDLRAVVNELEGEESA